MKIRKSNIIDKCKRDKHKAWVILSELALVERNPEACSLIIELAEFSEMREGGSDYGLQE